MGYREMLETVFQAAMPHLSDKELASMDGRKAYAVFQLGDLSVLLGNLSSVAICDSDEANNRNRSEALSDGHSVAVLLNVVAGFVDMAVGVIETGDAAEFELAKRKAKGGEA